jgi:shikimate kinase
LQCPFVDTDRLIEESHPSLSCRDIFQFFGIEYFRHLENQAIASLKLQSAIVLATGGGTLLQPSNAEKLKAQSRLIYLKTSLEILKERIWQRQALPAYLNSNDPHHNFALLYQGRVAIYEKWADVIVEMDGLTIQEAVHQLMKIAQNM